MSWRCPASETCIFTLRAIPGAHFATPKLASGFETASPLAWLWVWASFSKTAFGKFPTGSGLAKSDSRCRGDAFRPSFVQI